MAEKLFRNGRFDFIGELAHAKETLTTSKLSPTSEWERTRLGVGVKDDNNMQFLNMEYIHSSKVKTCKILNKDGEMEEVNLADTTSDKVMNKANDMIKITIDLETDFEKKKEYTKLIFKKRNHEMKSEDEKTDEDREKIAEYAAQIKELANNRVEFCHIKDAIAFINSAIPMLKDYKIRVTGNVKSNFYNDKNNLQYVPSFIEIVPKETENQLKAFLDIFYEKDSIDDDKKLKKFIVNGYVGERIKKADKLYPLTIVIDYAKVDEENPEHIMFLDFMKDNFKITDKKMIHKMGVEINVINGAEKVEFDESCLTDNQKMGIKLGLNTIDDFKPKGNVYGNRTTELRVCKGDLKAFPNGAVEVFAVKDLSEYLVSDDSDKNINDVKKTEEIKETSNSSAEDMMKKLFGK